MRRTLSAVIALVCASLVGPGAATLGCAHGSVLAGNSIAEMDRVRSSPAAREGRALAPQQYEHAEEQGRLARQAEAEGDGVSATLYAERSMASYEHALVLARLARATEDAAAARKEFEATDERARQLAAARADVEREADDLDKRLRVAKEALAPVASGPVDAAREAARLVAARSLAMQGRLLCAAGRLLAPNLPAAEEEKAVVTLDLSLGAHGRRAAGPSPIDAAARARAACLGFLTRARRDGGTAHGGDADALLEELAASGGWEPSRDERGVLVTLRDAFKGRAVEANASKKLEELGRVAAAHPAFGMQVVVHDAAEPPRATDAEEDTQRADAARAALVAGGAVVDHVQALTAGARVPVVDPADARHRTRNARLEVVFVAP